MVVGYWVGSTWNKIFLVTFRPAEKYLFHLPFTSKGMSAKFILFARNCMQCSILHRKVKFPTITIGVEVVGQVQKNYFCKELKEMSRSPKKIYLLQFFIPWDRNGVGLGSRGQFVSYFCIEFKDVKIYREMSCSPVFPLHWMGVRFKFLFLGNVWNTHL